MTSAKLPTTNAARHGTDDRLLGMTAAHDAFRRDLARLTATTERTRPDDPAARASVLRGWTTFKAQMHKHHGAEDAYIWPRLRERLATSDAALSVLAAMEAEHDQIDPLMAAVDAAFDAPDADPAGPVGALYAALSHHLAHEEREALPMIREALTDEEWQQVNGAIRQAGMASVAEYLPWLTDGVPDADRDRILTLLPPPMRATYAQQWRPAYDRVSRW